MVRRNMGGDGQMYQGNWSCSECGAAITELPFQPNGTSPLYCRDCHRQKRGNNSQRSNNNFRERRTFTGNWSCSQCGAAITELPFEPKDDQSLLCRDCYRSQRNS